MSFFDENTQLKNQIDSLPDDLRHRVLESGADVKSSDELTELVRRIRSAETGKIF